MSATSVAVVVVEVCGSWERKRWSTYSSTSAMSAMSATSVVVVVVVVVVVEAEAVVNI